MRSVCAVLLLFAGACSSSGLQKNVIEGGPGQPIAVSISGVDNSVTVADPDKSRQYTVQVEVSNETDALLTVTGISIETSENRAFQVYATRRPFNELIDPGKAHLFDIVLRGRQVRPFAPNEARTVVLRVIVSLSDGDSYVYEFEGPVHEEAP